MTTGNRSTQLTGPMLPATSASSAFAASPSRAPRPRLDRRLLPLALILVLAVAAVYAQTCRHEFLNYDDDVYLLDNPPVMRGLSGEGFAWAFGYHAGNWHPLTWLSHMLDAQLFGTWAGGHHLVSAGLHAANAVLLAAVLARMTGAFWRSAAVAALFALHPLRVESVAWAAERKDVLSGLLWMLALGAYLRYARKPGTARYLAVVGVFVLGLASKPMLVSLPFVLLLLDWWPLGRLRTRTLLLEKVPFLLLAAASSALTLLAQTESARSMMPANLPLRIANALVSTVAYLRQFLWPADLAVLYPYPVEGIPWQATAGALGVIALASVAALLARRRAPFFAVGLLWYLVMLVPVIGIVQVGLQARANRYTYLPLIGIVVGLVWLVDLLWPRTVPARALLGAVAAALLVALGGASAVQAGRWKDSLTLMEHTVRVTKDNFVAMNNLGSALIRAGRFEEAMPVLQGAARSGPLYPFFEDALYNLGLARIATRRFEEAIPVLEQAIRIRPFRCDAHYNLGVALASTRRYPEARRPYESALRCYEEQSPGSRDVADTHFNLANVSIVLKRYGEALPHLREVMRIEPDYPGAQLWLSVALAGQRKEEALRR